MTTVCTFDAYVRMRLDAWGREFRLDRQHEQLGHRSKNMLAILIEHAGEIPPPNVGFKPLLIPPLEMQVEDIVRTVHADTPMMAAILRAYYCGSGRVGVERLAQARHLADSNISKRQFYTLHDLGFQRVAGALAVIARAA
jgi:hypothetical protein